MSHISTNIDPDYRGNLLIAVHNPSRNVIDLPYSESFCTLNFIQNVSPSTKGCGKDPGRTDQLLEMFADGVKGARDTNQKMQRKRNLLNIILKAILIIIPSIAGYYFFGSTPGFIAMTALGVGLAGNISMPKR